jgi:hypothetical protein
VASPDLEDVIIEVMNIFIDQFPSKLAEVDGRKSSPLSPNPPIKFYFGDINNIPQMPAMLFTGHETREDEDENEWRRQIYRLEIEAYYAGQDVQQLSKIVRRYGTAIDEVLRANQSLGGVAQSLSNISQKYWDSMSSKTGLMQAVNVSFDVIVMTN